MDDIEALALAAAAKRRKTQALAPNPDAAKPGEFFPDPVTGGMVSREMLDRRQQPSRGQALASGYMQGYSAGFGDEILGGAFRAIDGPDMGRFAAEDTRAMVDANAEAYPFTHTAGRVVGAVLNPLNRIIPGGTTITSGARAGATYGAIEGIGEGEGGIADRAASGAKGGAVGFISGGLTSVLGKALVGVAKGSAKAVTTAFQRAERRPSVETLRQAKNAAYAAVRRAGIEFGAEDLSALVQRVDRRARLMTGTGTKGADFDPDVDRYALAAQRLIANRADDGSISLNRLDKIRQRLWTFYNQSDNGNGGHPFILDAIEEIDATIANKAQGNTLMEAAREANSRFSKAKLLDNAFWKADLQTASTGSGGNILNKYRQAVTRILTNPKESRWFTQDERQLMEAFIRGSDTENILRRAGKLAPGGNGLMLALGIYAGAVDPTAWAVAGASQVAKSAADKGAMGGAELLKDAVSTGAIPTPKGPLPTRGLGVGGAAAGNALIR